jgi:hypothetical protein
MSKTSNLVFAGIACFPRSPLADLHGLIRVVVKAGNRHKALSTLHKAGIKQCYFFTITWSAVERAAAKPNAILACALPFMYLKAEHYEVVEPGHPKKRKRSPKR